MENELHRFWNLESLGISEQENYVKDFSDIIYQNENLKYKAKLPFQEPYPLLPDHFSLWEKGLQKLYSFPKNDQSYLKSVTMFLLNKRKTVTTSHITQLGNTKTLVRPKIVFDESARTEGPRLSV